MNIKEDDFLPIKDCILKTKFEKRVKHDRQGRKTRGRYSVEYIEINKVRFYYMGQFASQSIAYLTVTVKHPGIEWIIWPRGGWGNPVLPAVYVRDPDREKELREEKKAAKEAAKKAALKAAKKPRSE
jgi:hypothetical protein